MEFEMRGRAERRPLLLVEARQGSLVYWLGRYAVQHGRIVVKLEISGEITGVPALTRLFNTAHDRIHSLGAHALTLSLIVNDRNRWARMVVRHDKGAILVGASANRPDRAGQGLRSATSGDRPDVSYGSEPAFKS
jgi:hypothetical protein